MKIKQLENRHTVSFSPQLKVDDSLAAYWLQQVTTRLRREICWLQYIMSPLMDKASDALTRQRYWEEKQNFFKTDPTAKYLTDKLFEQPPAVHENSRMITGSFSWVVLNLSLDESAVFLLALALSTVFDSAVGSIISLCLNDPLKVTPTLALAQKLWDRPDEILSLSDPDQPLFRFGLIHLQSQQSGTGSFINWDSPILVPTLIARQLLFPVPDLPAGFAIISSSQQERKDYPYLFREIGAALVANNSGSLRLVPFLGKKNTAFKEMAAILAKLGKRKVVEDTGALSFFDDVSYFKVLIALCWLKGTDLFLNQELTAYLAADKQQMERLLIPLKKIPITLFMSFTDKNQLNHCPQSMLMPVIHLSHLGFKERRNIWVEMIKPESEELKETINEAARRFRYEKEAVKQIARRFLNLSGSVTSNDFIKACRAHLEIDLGELAQKVIPRFKDEALILPPREQKQFNEIEKAMKSLTEVHYEWGTAKAWNECGISVLFAGPPGTGKTMAAEILAIDLDLPIYRIDLSQVVNKYIGETEKNLKRLFDAADISDLILFFDEADSLFGRRTEVKDAHDRYANLEISYLLERMERFKGLAILATNRKKYLDDAFLRRLRYIIDFPYPGPEQRKRIWQQVVPKFVDCRGIDFDFLAQEFCLTGGHIRSIVFNACLQSAHGNSKKDKRECGVLTMEQVIIGVKREYDKLNQSISLESFGPYAKIVEDLEKKDAQYQD